ncbi:T9SS type A sorting domain-containing protein [Aequorivita sp. SDUM287046]|uniref:T9SS type A sorting domain-containing protein n=1 Tax=Aequorivita aurantiaca TaxID=3053356 RepID=A0ABT8DGV4_9FLAO|nr:T9SS type A sorting domain-containing protein [Aequorivita aurantiaca]MDN3723969.1 T9SS type A sorting domain-containing protein [Aequorivita aurantiaca]
MKNIFTFLTFVLSVPVIWAQSGSQEFTASGDFTVPAGITSITIEVIGGGGGGGNNGSGGGGGGGYAMGTFTVAPSDVISVTIGAGGESNTAGETTSVGAFIEATGGGPGTWVPHPDLGGGGAGGVGSGGTINYSGGAGGGGYWTYFGGGGGGAAGSDGDGANGGDTIPWTGNCITPGGSGGESGGIPGGYGGKGAGITNANCTITDPAASGLPYGGGGGGGNGIGSDPGAGHSGYALISWGPQPCASPSDLGVMDIQLNSVILDWTENGSATTWLIEWGISGFTLGTGTSIVTQEKPYLLEGLMANTFYDYYVQSNCGGTGSSTWSGPFTFQTETLGTAENTIEGFAFYPNPMKDLLQLSANSTIENVIIYNVLGQKVLDQNIRENSAQLNISNLSAGNYFMKVISGGQTGVYRLIK